MQAEADRRKDDCRRKSQPKKGHFSIDIWETDKIFEINKNKWMTDNTKKHNLRGVGVPVKNTRKSVSKKSSVLPAIEPPHPGMSYNPSYEDHQDLLRIVAEKEQQVIKEEEHLTRCTTGMFQKVAPEKKDQSWLVEMSEGLPSTTGTNVEENEASDNEYKATNPPVKNAKKTLKQKRKQKEQQQLEEARRKLQLEKKKVTDIHQLKIVTKQIAKIERKQNLLQEKRKRKAELKKNKIKVLGALKFEEPDLEFNMGQEISGNLKDLKTEGNLLTDRFKSMQKRNILAPTKRHAHKKAKVKKYTKPGHKDQDWKKMVAR
ncbi:hypothetical protein NQ318_021381 [Aromia moschata]|uniref:Ribosome biogenesis protein NOP53 n=1 Tax=Aromia moschata TaxID=1265417 RepID=A0AAV8ZEJ6_9CUCU|nr:hypothetical protein NQ318_021381 [Aromia moschata]